LTIVGGFSVIDFSPVACQHVYKHAMQRSIFIYAQVGLVIEAGEVGDVNGVGPLL
jgi:hypothetical protein